MRNVMLMILMLFSLNSLVHANNVALAQLNAMLAKKEGAMHADTALSPGLKNIQENYYFVFIYRSNCPHCHKFAPVLQDFTKTFSLEVDAYSLDGQALEGFQAKALTPELFQTLYATASYKPVVPALFLVNRHTQQAYAALFGEAEPYQLASRVNELVRHIEEKFHD